MRRFARVLRRFADQLDPPPQIVADERYVPVKFDTATSATPANVTLNWFRRG